MFTVLSFETNTYPIKAFVWNECKHHHSKFHLRFGHKETPPECLNKNIATSLAVYTFLAVSVDKCKSPEESNFLMSYLANLVPLASSYISCVAERSVEINNVHIHIDKHGQASGFKACTLSVHSAIQKVVAQDTWLHKHICNIVAKH